MSDSGQTGSMCGRFATPDAQEVVNAFDVRAVTTVLSPSLNLRPTQRVGIVIDDAEAARRENRDVHRELREARWGLVPSWTKIFDKRLLLINARAESVLSKPSFRSAIRQRRALVPATGYYEWVKNSDGTKTAFFLYDPDQSCLGFAGLYEWWKAPEDLQFPGVEDGWLCSTTIITKAAVDALGHIHDRMPVIIPSSMTDLWLDPRTTDPDQVDALLHSIPDPRLVPIERGPG